MPWFKVDDGLASKIETTRIPRAHRAAAIGLWVLAGSWSARELTDGFIPDHMVDELAGTPESAALLVTSGYWSEVEGGFQFVVWDGEQPMRAKVLEARRKNTEKVTKWRARNRTVTESHEGSEEVANQGRTEVVNPAPDPTRPDPSRPTSNEVTSSPEIEEPRDRFDDFYSIWPRKVDKPAAKRAWAKAITRVDADLIIAAAVAYRDNSGIPNEQFIRYPATWLNADGWNDDLPVSRNRPSPDDQFVDILTRGQRLQELADRKAIA